MPMKKMMLIVFISMVLIACSKEPIPINYEKPLIVGGDKDEHGCIGSAGYSWCEPQQKCLRVWEEPCGQQITLGEAITIANNSVCTENGKLMDETFYNNVTKTWWIELDIKKDGCNPACVVSEETKTAEINWRCTGLAR